MAVKMVKLKGNRAGRNLRVDVDTDGTKCKKHK
jgi:hypothetical protein